MANCQNRIKSSIFHLYKCSRFNMLSGFLVRRGDDTVMFYHPLFRDWLIRRKDNESTKFMVDPRNGHLAMALTSSRNNPKDLTSDKILDLCHHMLKAHVFRNHQTLSKDLQSVRIQQHLLLFKIQIKAFERSTNTASAKATKHKTIACRCREKFSCIIHYSLQDFLINTFRIMWL